MKHCMQVSNNHICCCLEFLLEVALPFGDSNFFTIQQPLTQVEALSSSEFHLVRMVSDGGFPYYGLMLKCRLGL